MPGLPNDPHQPRPALVVSTDIRNAQRRDILVVPAFSAGRIGPTRVPIAIDTGGMPHDSVLFCDLVTAIHRDYLAEGPLGAPVPEALMQSVVLGVRRALGEVLEQN